MQARGKNQRGFSLIELLTVMVVITILAGWAVMGTGGFSTASKANAAMGIVVTELRQARQLAITSRRNVLVTITPPNQIQLAIETLPGEAPAQPISPRYLNDNAKDGMQSSVGNSNLVNASIFLGKPGDDRTARAITVLGGTGRVRSFTWDGLKWEE